MNLSKKAGIAVAVLCIMALVTAAASAASMPWPVGQQSAGHGSKQPGTGPGQQQQMANTNVINPVPTQSGSGTPGTILGRLPGQGTTGNQAYTMEQTLSDQAQGATIAFDALAFLTGQACSDTFLPPGKVADYAGFQYLRDNDATQMGHNTDFVTRVSDNVLITLDNGQLAQFIALSKTEAPLSSHYGYMRFPLTKAFRAQLEGTIPAGSSGLDRAALMAYSAELYDVDASISLERARTYASVIRSLNQTQRAYLDKMASGGILSSPVVDASAVLKNSGQENSVAMRTYASEMFAWYAGSVTADVYFCPERQATYFGSFYMKDRPAMGNPDYSISTTLTGDSGEAFLNALTETQREKITSLVDLQRADLNEIVAKRTAIATELRTALTGDTIDENLVRSLSARYGELDGEISYYYATHFAEVGKTTTSEQKLKMVALRNLEGYVCEGAYLYSQPVSMPQNVPSDFLFGVGKYDSSQMSAWLQGLRQTTISPVPSTTPKVEVTTTPLVRPTTPVPTTTPKVVVTKVPGFLPTTVTPVIPGLKTGIITVNSNPRGASVTLDGNVLGTTPVARKTVTAGTHTITLALAGYQTYTGKVTVNPNSETTVPLVILQKINAYIPEVPGITPSKPVVIPTPTLIWWQQQGRTISNRFLGEQTNQIALAQVFSLTSDIGVNGGKIPIEYTCDGSGSTPALSWSGAPAGTKEFALMMTTIPVDSQTRWNWVLYGIPGSVTSLAKDSSGVGTLGTGSHGTIMNYDPPCPQGPGEKVYTFTLYALSGSPMLPGNTAEVTGPVLTDAISSLTIGKASLNLSYARPE
ncbi:MAG: PEGA domain-containing protein [Methanomicrobiales archaeon]|nr:PEGA domain-containing protein [Methanomicrobiales archaeon]